jgi:hypothetical protein
VDPVRRRMARLDFAEPEEEIEGEPPVAPAVKAVSLASLMGGEPEPVQHPAMETQQDLEAVQRDIERLTGHVITTRSAYDLQREHDT